MVECQAVESLTEVYELSAVTLDITLEDQTAEHVKPTPLGVEPLQYVQVSDLKSSTLPY